MKINKQISDTFLTGALLALAGGYLDGYTYINRGGVFANAQTGNIVLLGISVMNGAYLKVFHYLLPILAFIAGIVVTELIREIQNKKGRLHWRQWIVFVELILLGVVFLMPSPGLDVAANIVISFISAVQIQTFRKIEGKVFASTMCTGNLRSGSEQLYRYIRNGEKKALQSALQYFLVIFIFILGAVISVYFSRLLAGRSISLVMIPLLIVFLIMFIQCERSEN